MIVHFYSRKESQLSAMEYLTNLKANYFDIPVNSLDSLDIEGQIISKLPKFHHHDSAHVRFEDRFCVCNINQCQNLGVLDVE